MYTMYFLFWTQAKFNSKEFLLYCFLLFTVNVDFIRFKYVVLAKCAAHIGMVGMRIEKEPRQKDEYVYRTS